MFYCSNNCAVAVFPIIILPASVASLIMAHRSRKLGGSSNLHKNGIYINYGLNVFMDILDRT